MLRRASGTLVLVLVAGLVSGFAPAASPTTTEIADRVLAATVGISCTSGGGSFRGTGTIISPQGHVLTATSVVPADATGIRVMLPGFAVREARVVAVDADLTATIIRLEGINRDSINWDSINRDSIEQDGDTTVRQTLPWLPLARELPEIGAVAYTAADVDRVLVTNGRASFSRGRVSGIYDVDSTGESSYRGQVIETTAAVNQGSDGGPLVDSQGRLCGMLSGAVSPLRWQGVAVPIATLWERWPALGPGGLPLPAAPADGRPAGGLPADDPRTAGLRRSAAALAPHLVGIEVVRKYPPEILPQSSWSDHRSTIADWATLPAAAQRQRFATVAERARVLEVNQLLRRPAGQVTGLLVSADGDILTSLFNVGTDTAFVAKRTGEPRQFAAGADLERLSAEPEGGLERRPNPPVSFTVVLADGSRHAARLRARHEPLGVALLKIDSPGRAGFDVVDAATSPQLGDPVAVLGWTGAAPASATLNAGVVSAAARNRGLQFQTDALLNYGNSGGPVVDAAGNLLGVAAAPLEPDTVQGRIFSTAELMRWTRAPNSGVGLVARADRIRDVLEDLRAGRSFERVPGPYLGVMADSSRAFGEDVFVGGVAPGSPAEAAGIKKGDRILEFNGAELRDWRDLTDRIAAAAAGDTVTLTVERRSRGPRLVIAGRDIETAADLERLKRSLRPGDTFTGELTTDDRRRIDVVLGENR
jgi:S1-C subfamily serine protease